MTDNPILTTAQVGQKIAELHEAIERRDYWTKQVAILAAQLTASGEARLMASQLLTIFDEEKAK